MQEKTCVVAFVAFFAVTGCSASDRFLAGTPLRHIAFHHPLVNDASAVGSTGFADLKALHSDPITRFECHRSFRHPLLNRCDSWLSTQAKNRPNLLDKSSLDSESSRTAVASLVGNKVGVDNSQGHPADCVSLVRQVLAESRISLGSVESRTDENGVSILYRQVAMTGHIHRQKVPAVGDLIFFNNTHDRNRNGLADDLLTHVGIVESVDADGTVHFVHRVSRGVLRARMNLFHPDVRRDPTTRKVWNHFLRVGAKIRGKSLTGELFHSFGSVVPW